MSVEDARARRKALSRSYKETPRAMGVYRIAHATNSRCLIGSSADVTAILNRHRAQLRMGGHPNRALQAEWDADGPDAFTFEILDRLDPVDDPEYDPTADLLALEAMWLERLHAERGQVDAPGSGDRLGY
jgi:hypothetical protein